MSRKIIKTPTEWQQMLSPMEYYVAREKGTERAFSGAFWDHWKAGEYHCRCCGAPLFAAGDKFDAGCGWPSFSQPASGAAIEEAVDLSHGMRRTEVMCDQCGAHLGHVFEDGPPPTGLRYCINSASIAFVAESDGSGS